MARPTTAPLVLLASLALGACHPSATTATPAEPAATPAAAPLAATDAGSTPAACRDWSALDTSTLPPLPAGTHTKLFEQVWTTVWQRHYDPTLACLDWPALRVRYGERVAKAGSDAEAFAAIGEMLAELEQSHLGLIPPAHEADAQPGEARPTGAGRVPLELTMLGDELVVEGRGWQGKKGAVPPGSTVVSIGGHTVAQLVADSGKRWPARRVERDFHVERTALAWLSCDAGQRLAVTWLAPGKAKPTTRELACHVPKLRTASFGNLRDVPVEVEAKLLPPSLTKAKVGYLRFNIWLMDLAPELEQGLAALRKAGMESLVIDLRGNPGGVGAMVVPVGRLLLDRDADLGVMRMRGAEQRFAVKRGADPFLGPVVILIDGGTASTSEIFAQALKDLGRARIVGSSESQGAALPSLIERLDGGALLQYVVADYTSPGGVAVEGKGVVPDIVVPVRREDLEAGRDAVLAAALTALAQPPSPGTAP